MKLICAFFKIEGKKMFVNKFDKVALVSCRQDHLTFKLQYQLHRHKYFLRVLIKGATFTNL